MKIPEDLIEKIKEENDIVDVVSESINLKKSGRNYFGLCPFHHENTPSFSVSPDKQIFKCFGCGEAGNVITFVMKIKNLSFIEAVKLLADRVNIDIEPEDEGSRKKRDYKEKLYKLNLDAARYYYRNLQKNIEARKYLFNRGITQNTIISFRLGYSYDSWDASINFLKKKGYTELDILNSGLVAKSKNGKTHDRFRGRVMFPIMDYRERIIGFGGRVLDDSKPKYLNSPETIIFDKGTNLYGLNFAAKNAERTIIIVEGYMDCISLHQSGIKNAVASLGTSLTIGQAKLLKRYADRIIISYDADNAGQTATLRGLEILKKENFDVRVLKVPEGKDPDEFVRKNGKNKFLELVKDSLPLIDYRIKRAGEGVNLKSEEGMIKYLRSVTDILANLDPVEKDVYIKKVSENTNISEQAIYDLLNGKMQKNVNILQQMNIFGKNGQKLYIEPAYVKAERCLIRILLEYRNNKQKIINNIKLEDFVLEAHKKIYKIVLKNDDKKYVESCLDDPESIKEWVYISNMKFDAGQNNDKLIKDCIKDIKKYNLENKRNKIMQNIKKNEKNGKLHESVQLAQELVKIQKEIGRL